MSENAAPRRKRFAQQGGDTGRFIEGQRHRQRNPREPLLWGKPHRVLLGHREDEVSRSGFSLQAGDLRLGEGMMVGEISGGDDIRANSAQRRIKLFRPCDAGEGENIAAGQTSGDIGIGNEPRAKHRRVAEWKIANALANPHDCRDMPQLRRQRRS